MYSNSDFERFFIRYKAEAVPAGESMQKFCFRNKLSYNLFEKWYKDTRHKLVPVHVEGAPASLTESTSENEVAPSPQSSGIPRIMVDIRMTNGIHIQQRKLRWSKTLGREVGGFMLSITGLNQFYYLRGFHDMRCKYERVLSIIHQQLDREPQAGDVFIVMSKDHRLIRLFGYDSRSYSLYEKRFVPGYKFMHVEFENDLPVHKINWEDVVLLLESSVIKRLNIR